MLGSNVIENFRWIRFRGGRSATPASRNLKARSKFHKLLSSWSKRLKIFPFRLRRTFSGITFQEPVQLDESSNRGQQFPSFVIFREIFSLIISPHLVAQF